MLGVAAVVAIVMESVVAVPPGVSAVGVVGGCAVTVGPLVGVVGGCVVGGCVMVGSLVGVVVLMVGGSGLPSAVEVGTYGS